MKADFKVDHIKADILIIGAGGAGSRAAVEAAHMGKKVVLICRSPLGKGGLTPTGNGGYHAAVWPGDSPEIHAEDLVKIGCNLNDRNLVRVLTEEARQQAQTLQELGAKVTWEVPPKPSDPQMRYPRALYLPGKEILSTLKHHLLKQKNVIVLEDRLALQLVTANGRVSGAIFLNSKNGNLLVCACKAVILATGSMGEIYPLTAHEPMGIRTGSTGSGYVMAAWAGAELVDMEMVQFTIMPIAPPLISGLRCLPWAELKNNGGKPFLPAGLGGYSYEAARLIWQELNVGRGPVYMDLRGNEAAIRRRHPAAQRRSALLKKFGVTPYQRKVQVGLGALFMMGGIHIDERCETSVPGLYAAGEVSANVHGAKRVPGNAFTEMIVFGARAGKFAAHDIGRIKNTPEISAIKIKEVHDYLKCLILPENGGIAPEQIRNEVRSVMGRHVHMVRDREGLNKGLARLESLEKDLDSVRVGTKQGLSYNQNLIDGIDARWMVACAKIICQAAMIREESRGFHFRSDFAEENKDWLKHTVIKWTNNKGLESSVKPISP